MRFFAGKSSASKGKPQKGGGPDPAPLQFDLDRWLDICGVALLAVAALTLFGLLSTQRSPILSGWLEIVGRLFGWGVYLAPAILAALGVYLLVRRFGDRFPRLRPKRLGGAVLAYLTALATLHGLTMIADEKASGAQIAAASQGGGELGWLILSVLISLLGNIGAGVMIVMAWIAAVMLIADVSLPQLFQAVRQTFTPPKRDPAATNVARVPGAPTDDIIEPDYGRSGGLIIRGLRPRRATAKQQREAKGEAPAAPSPSDAELPPARTISEAPAHGAEPAAALKINSPASRGQINRVPPPRIIGAPDAPAARSAASKAEPARQSPPVSQPAAASAVTVSSIYPVRRNWVLPKIEDVLEPGSDAAMKEAEIRQRAALIEDTLRAFGVPARVVEVNRGPTITQFGVEPGFNEMKGGKQVKVKVSRIAALADDLALALAAPRIRIEAPIPGRALVGIEVPNGETSLVALRDVMESEEFEALRRKTRLPLALGQDVSGRPVVADLTSMPHLLIAGTTGSGKSVCVNAIIVALLCSNTPEDLRFLMIDPKRVELTGYNGVPHLIAPVVVDLEKTTAVLQWVTREMDRRYRLFAKHGARNIVEFNAKVAAYSPLPTSAPDQSRVGSQESPDDDLHKLPYIVVVIDELADLMMMAPDETEKIICRLAQMARATGIHLILATQRPSVDVVTGLIKANFPARIAFTVATSVDSRVILDGPGAEKLLGRGDMLVVTPEQSMPMRAQGCFLSPAEIERVVRHWRAQLGDPATVRASNVLEQAIADPPAEAAPAADLFSAPPPTWEEARALSEAAREVNAGSKDDKLFNEAVATVRLQGKASISLLQRRLRIGYTRAARLIEEMEERGIVGPAIPGQQYREVLNSPLSGTDEP
ncbi:MAG: DNA translocase FtsK [Anaerolineae bacterium]|nr:DNA translocase FtsK [Candidatus Roseilinea sp.]MDW8448522.1 DNA translocase FtsK [Anaerolineae bacterium]